MRATLWDQGDEVRYLREARDRRVTPEAVDFGPYAEQHLEEVTWRGLTLRVPEISTHLRPNEARGRLDRVALIRAYAQRGEGDRGR